MKKTVLFVILDQYADWEAAYLAAAINELGKGKFEVKTVSLTKEAVQSIGGFHAIPDYNFKTVPADYEALILIGGMTWRKENASQIKTLVMDCYNKGKVLGGICDASAFLGTTGVLNKVKHTSNELDDMKEWAGAAYTGEANYILEQAVRDQNIITAHGTAPLEFAKEVLLALDVTAEETILSWYRFQKLGFYKASIPDTEMI